MLKGFVAGVFAVVLLFVGSVGNAVAGSAAPIFINVTTTSDEYGEGTACSLREAITAINTEAPFGGCATGTGIQLRSGTYRSTRVGADEDGNVTGDFDFSFPGDVTVTGVPGARVIIHGNGHDRVFDARGSGGFLVFKDLRITGGKLTANEDGAGLRVAAGQVRLHGVTVDRNASAYQGGGAAVYGFDLGLTNSTISGNSAGQNGGGIYVAGGSNLYGTSSTITANRADADNDGNGAGGGFAQAGGNVIQFWNVLNGGNHAPDLGAGTQSQDCYSGASYKAVYTLQTQPFGQLYCDVTGDSANNTVTDDARLGPLAYNGGQTPTHGLLADSPARGAGSPNPMDCPDIDQNGRVRATPCDIGSVRYSPSPMVGQKNPSKKIAVFDGKRLHVRLNCPARFKPRCISRAVPVVRRGGAATGNVKKVVSKSNQWKRVVFVIKPAFRDRVQAMTELDQKRLVVRQVIRSKRVGKRKAKKPAKVFHIYKVRVKL